MSRHAAVLGDPVAHSRSPQLHMAAYAALGLTDWHYHALGCSPADLPGLLDRLRGSPRWVGLSLTRPLKEVAPALLDRVLTDIGAVNTIVMTDGSLIGHNTDVAGIEAGLRAVGIPLEQVAVLGAGGTARAALAALAGAAVGPVGSVTLHVRSPERAAAVVALAERLGLSVRVLGLGELPPAAVVVSTLPAGVADGLTPCSALLDAVYDPWPTTYATRVRAGGGRAVGGYVVLAAQAAAQVTLFTGRSAPLDAMRSVLPGEAAIGEVRGG